MALAFIGKPGGRLKQGSLGDVLVHGTSELMPLGLLLGGFFGQKYLIPMRKARRLEPDAISHRTSEVTHNACLVPHN